MEIDKQIIEYARGYIARYLEIEELLQYPEVNADTRLYLRLSKEYLSLSKIIDKLKEYERTEDTRLIKEIGLLIDDKKEQEVDAIIEINAKGSESNSLYLSRLILKMYQNFAFLEGYDFEILDISEKGEGIKSAKILVSKAYALLKGETGTHIGEKGENVSVLVIPKIESREYEMGEKDIRIDLFHSSGAGGQNVNKVQSAVRVTHLNTGISVVCQDERSQLKNRQRALENLRKRLNELMQSNNKKECDKIKKGLEKAKNTKLRVYNFNLNEATDIKTNLSLNLKEVLNGRISPFLDLAKLNTK